VITAVTDGVIRTHDDAKAFIESLAPGAQVTLTPWARDPLSQARRYTIRYKKHGLKPISVGDTYALPVLEQSIENHIRTNLLKVVES
jgi:hypothetical protein